MSAAVLMNILQNCAIKNGTMLRESRQVNFCELWASKHVLQPNGMHECVCVHVQEYGLVSSGEGMHIILF